METIGRIVFAKVTCREFAFESDLRDIDRFGQNQTRASETFQTQPLPSGKVYAFSYLSRARVMTPMANGQTLMGMTCIARPVGVERGTHSWRRTPPTLGTGKGGERNGNTRF